MTGCREKAAFGAIGPIGLLASRYELVFDDPAFAGVANGGRDELDRINGTLKLDSENRASIDRLADLKQRSDSLTPREREVMAFVVNGKANKVIAIGLGLSERTVEIHRANVMEKMGARSVAHLVKMHINLNGEA